MPLFRKKPVEIEAVRLTRPMTIETDEGTLNARPGDWLVTGVEGEQYPVKHSIFLKTYEPANGNAEKYLAEYNHSHLYHPKMKG